MTTTIDAQDMHAQNPLPASDSAPGATATGEGDQQLPALPSALSAAGAGVNVVAFPAPALVHMPASSGPEVPVGYILLPDGVYALSADDTAEPLFTCSPLRVGAIFSDGQGKGWGRLVSVKSPDGRWHDIPLMNAQLQGRPAEVIRALVDCGLELATDSKAKDRLIRLLRAWKPGKQLRTTETMGWVDDSFTGFVIGDRVVGNGQVLPRVAAASLCRGLSEKDTADAGKTNVGALCTGNPMMILAASTAFSGPLLGPLGLSGGGLHFRGASSSGKTTLLRLAASVWGSSQLILPWRATSNGLESMGAAFNDMLLLLDEIAENDARELHDAIYMLANGTGKGRMTNAGTATQQHRWSVALMSSGEITVAEKLAEASKTGMAGHEVRLIDIEADGCKHGVFDELHGLASPQVFADTIRAAAREHHGAVGPAFVKKLISEGIPADRDKWTRLMQAKAKSWLAKLSTGADG